jgi:hypothetical protein
MSARNETLALMQRFGTRDISLSFEDANALRRAQITLHRWAELECGDGNAYGSWAIERNEETGVPYMCNYPHTGKMRAHKIPDREKGALQRITEICKRNGLHFYHQGDPRGCALYIAKEPLSDVYYHNGIACC